MQFIDLKRQYDVIKEDVNARIQAVLENQSFIMGSEVAELEQKLAQMSQRKHVLCCASGTDALVIPLMALGIKENDAVFMPAFTFFATGEAVAFLGATPVFVDSDETYNMDLQKLRDSIENVLKDGKLTPKMVIPVDIFGLPVDYDEILKIASSYDLIVLADSAQSFGGSYKGRPVGSFGRVCATSFFPAKPLGCYGDGGAIFTDDDELATVMKSIRVHGQGSDRYDNVRLGMNGRMDTLQCAVVLSKLQVFEQEIAKRQEIAKAYSELLSAHFATPVQKDGDVSAWAQYTLLAKSEAHRAHIISELKKKDIPIMVYYAKPLHMQTAFSHLGYKSSDLPNCERFSKTAFSIPMHPYLQADEIAYISKCLVELSDYDA